MIRTINIICYTIALLSIMAVVLIAIALIWGNRDNEAMLYRAITTAGLFFVASTLIISLNGVFQKVR